MTTRTPVAAIVGPLRELLELAPTLSSNDAKVLEALMLDPRPASAREIGRATRTNLQGLYGSLDRLVARGLVARTEGSSSMLFRAANPTVVLHELLAPFHHAQELVREVEAPLRTLYESRDQPSRGAGGPSSLSTGSGTAASSWLLDRLAVASGEVWFLGSETPWFSRAPSLEAELGARVAGARPLPVRLLVHRPESDEPRARHHARLLRSGVEIRYSPRFASPAVLVDRRWMLVRSAGPSSAPTGAGSFLRLDAPEFCADVAVAADEEWQRSTSAPGPRGGHRGRTAAESGGPA